MSGDGIIIPLSGTKPKKTLYGPALVSMGQLKLNKHAAERGHRFKKTQNNKC